jgi:acetylornithine/succinyldiaminopimelate/putrescine aminotransferase
VLNREIELQEFIEPTLQHRVQTLLSEHKGQGLMIRIQVEAPSSQVKAKFAQRKHDTKKLLLGSRVISFTG